MWMWVATALANPGCVADSCESGAVPQTSAVSVLATPLVSCSTDPLTGWFRDGSCRTDAEDRGLHTVCAVMTESFLGYTRAQGNDLSSAQGAFPGLDPGDRWCLCAAKWEQARRAGVAPPVVLEATNGASLRVVELPNLEAHGVVAGGS